jgi:phosphoribosylglycinamide formyltransferase-1
MPPSSIINVAIFASGTGSNAKKIIEYFANAAHIKISLIVCNKKGAGVISIAEKEHIPLLLIDKEQFLNGDAYVEALKDNAIDFIVLAGFIWKIPSKLIAAYPNKIINIHPALLPKYGGKGMYGHFVHEAVVAAKDPESGITIHYVDEQYDHGNVIFQARCVIDPIDTADMVAQKVLALEHLHFPRVVEETIQMQNRR